MNNIMLGWELMGFGLIGVFTTLILFMASIHLIVKIFPYKEEDTQDNQ